MRVILLTKDGRCKWLEKKVLQEGYKRLLKASRNPFEKKLFVITDWISRDAGKVGVDLKWLKGLGVPAVRSLRELPQGHDFEVINTGYDSIVHEEEVLRKRGIPIVDLPCPFIRKVRRLFEAADPAFQYVLLCETNHIIVRNFASIFPKDLILVQMKNYRERIASEQNGKPLRLIPYVTFLPKHVETVFSHIERSFPDRKNDKIVTRCMWVRGNASPILEIEQLGSEQLADARTALLITTPGSVNKSLVSLTETLEARQLAVVNISSLAEYRRFERAHKRETVLLVRSPIPNEAERPIMTYIRHGYLAARVVQWLEKRAVRILVLGGVNRLMRGFNLASWHLLALAGKKQQNREGLSGA